jgi:hypothetical protein
MEIHYSHIRKGVAYGGKVVISTCGFSRRRVEIRSQRRVVSAGKGFRLFVLSLSFPPGRLGVCYLSEKSGRKSLMVLWRPGLCASWIASGFAFAKDDGRTSF